MNGITGLGQAFDYYMMQSEMSADETEEDFEEAIAAGLNPNNEDLQRQIFKSAGMDYKDMLALDQQRLKRRVEETYSTRRY